MTTTLIPPTDHEVRESVIRVERELFDRLRSEPVRMPRRVKALIGIGSFVVASSLVVGGGAVAGVWEMPGGADDTVLDEWRTVSGTGPTSVDLGEAPEGANWIALRWTCVGTGSVFYSLGGDTSAGSDCDESFLPLTSTGSPTFPLEPGDPVLEVTTARGHEWTTEYRFIHRDIRPWGVNANGETYGATTDDGEPDLIAVATPEGDIAYVKKADMHYVPDPLPDGATQAEVDAYNAEHADEVISVPAYTSDGETVVGEWVTGGENSGLKLNASAG